MSERLIQWWRSNPLEILFTTGRIGLHPPLDLELPDPAKREGLEDGFEDTEHAGEEPVEDPGDLVERPSSAA